MITSETTLDPQTLYQHHNGDARAALEELFSRPAGRAPVPFLATQRATVWVTVIGTDGRKYTGCKSINRRSLEGRTYELGWYGNRPEVTYTDVRLYPKADREVRMGPTGRPTPGKSVLDALTNCQ